MTFFSLCVRFTGSSNPLCDDTVVRGAFLVESATGEIVLVDPTLPADPVCIRCGIYPDFYTNTSVVTYYHGGTVLKNNTNGVVITDQGLIIENPALSFNDGDAIRCSINPPDAENSVVRVIYLRIIGEEFLS